MSNESIPPSLLSNLFLIDIFVQCNWNSIIISAGRTPCPVDNVWYKVTYQIPYFIKIVKARSYGHTLAIGILYSIPVSYLSSCYRKLDWTIFKGKVKIVMADPPWDIHMDLPYGTMTDAEMKSLRVWRPVTWPWMSGELGYSLFDDSLVLYCLNNVGRFLSL